MDIKLIDKIIILIILTGVNVVTNVERVKMLSRSVDYNASTLTS